MTLSELFRLVAAVTEAADKVEGNNYDTGIDFADQAELLEQIAEDATSAAETLRAVYAALGN